jgi:hypothetical protein
MEKQNKENNVALAHQAKSLLIDLEVGDFKNPVFELMESNIRCNESYYTAVYTTEEDLHQLCKMISEKMSANGWINNKNCIVIERKKYNYMALQSVSKKSRHSETDYFVAAFFPVNSSNPLFIPRTTRDYEILKKIRGYGKSFYYFSYHHNGPLTEYKKHDRCGDAVGECKCIYSTYRYSRFDSGEEHEGIRTKFETILFD